MKFLCDRCKTRYSIGDDRVRGKILKIRCKNCANVITVREGMTEAEDAAVALDRRARPTTAAPMATASAPAGGALASAFAAQLSKPPPALEEEWYVSVDGDQSGPFSLADAQRWIAGKAVDLDLHCWSEGFDDWLPVDKVSHFRGLRKKPIPATPPPRAARPPAPPPVVEDEPKPLFAATMASLEKASAAPDRGLGLPPITTAPTLKAPAAPANGLGAKANGTGSAPIPKLNDSGRVAKVAKPTPVAKSEPTRAPTVDGTALPFGSAAGRGQAPTVDGTALPFGSAAGRGQAPTVDGTALPFGSAAGRGQAPTVDGTALPFGSAAGRGQAPTVDGTALPFGSAAGRGQAPTVPGVGASPGAKALVAAFDTSSDHDPLDSMTSVDAPAFSDEPVTTAEPIAAKRSFDRGGGDAFAEARSKARNFEPAPAPKLIKPVPKPVPRVEDEIDEGSFDIGEVSRVVKLADLAKMGAPTRKPSRVPLQRGTGSNTALAAGVTGSKDPGLAALQAMDEGSGITAAPVVAQAHRRGLIMLIGVAAVLLIGVAIAVMYFVNLGDSDTGGGLGHAREIDTSRPEEVVREHMNDPVQKPDPTTVGPRPHHNIITQPTNPHLLNGSDETVGEPKGSRLKAEEIEDMAHKQEGGTQRCYMRAQKGVAGLDIGDLKKLSVTLTIDKGGNVTDVQFSEHGTETIGQCLGSQIKRWKFRESPGGTYRFVMAFAN